jgi:hypothetical protein
MDAHTSTTLEALERTAAWVQQVQVQVEQMKSTEEVAALVSLFVFNSTCFGRSNSGFEGEKKRGGGGEKRNTELFIS